MIRGPRVMILDPMAKQAPFAEFDTRTGRWRIWLAFDKQVDGGTYLDLGMHGICERVTLREDGIVENLVLVTGPVKATSK